MPELDREFWMRKFLSFKSCIKNNALNYARGCISMDGNGGRGDGDRWKEERGISWGRVDVPKHRRRCWWWTRVDLSFSCLSCLFSIFKKSKLFLQDKMTVSDNDPTIHYPLNGNGHFTSALALVNSKEKNWKNNQTIGGGGGDIWMIHTFKCRQISKETRGLLDDNAWRRAHPSHIFDEANSSSRWMIYESNKTTPFSRVFFTARPSLVMNCQHHRFHLYLSTERNYSASCLRLVTKNLTPDNFICFIGSS